MALAHKQPMDTSLEEALNSIRQIIADDLEKDDKEVTPQETSLPSRVVSFEEEKRKKQFEIVEESPDDILELTERLPDEEVQVIPSTPEIKAEEKQQEPQKQQEARMVDEAPPKEEKAEAPVDAGEVPDESAEIPDEFAAPEDGEAGLMAEIPDEGPADTQMDVKELLSANTIRESMEAFKGLDQLSKRFKADIEDKSFGKKTIDELMREVLRPLLKDWLDAHLPSLVKWLVAEQIEKMLRAQGIDTKATAVPTEAPEASVNEDVDVANEIDFEEEAEKTESA